MSNSKYNAEGYYDPTAYEALTNIVHETRKSAYRTLVFICSPYAGDTRHNTRKARDYSRFAVAQHAIPLAPHLLFPQFLDDDNSDQRRLGIFMGMVLMSKCREVWVFGRNITRGMAAEIDRAEKRGIPIRYFNEQCEEVLPK